VLLQDVQLRDYKAHLADRVPQQEVAVDVGPLNLDLKNFDSLGDKPFDLRLDSGLGKQGKLQAAGNVQLSPTSAQLKVATQDIDLRLAQAYLSPFIRLELRSGLLGSDLDVQLKSTEPLALSVTGSARVDQFHTLDTLRERDFVRWKQVRVNGLDYRHGESLAIERIELDQPYARFVINENLTTNVSELIVPQPATPNESKADAGKPLAIRIGGVAINDGSANFADFSLTPSFATAIQQMNGRIGMLDNQQPQAASVDIQGKVDRYAPMSIKGKLTPFDPLNSLDIATRFKNVELTTITPYSGKFAGYRIRKGRLNLDLHYRIEKGQLNADNKVLVENLQLGERVDSPDAVDLPIRLAVALLKDTQGRIALELPVKGDLNNPEFSVMPIVWQTLRNLVLRTAQAPFKFIAGLVGGSNVDLSTVPFAAGSTELQGDARQALDTLAKALQERPNLRLEVEGQAAQSADGPLLAEQRLQREFRETWYKVLQRRGDKVPASPDEVMVDEDEQAALLEGIYRSRLKQQPPAEWAELDSEQRQQNMRQAVLASWAQSKLLLRQLAQQRAATIKDYLVEQGGLYDERIYLIDANLGEAEADGHVLTTLHLDSQ
jgi:outer membrane protein OmpA-like peptidoglycan-associated protein